MTNWFYYGYKLIHGIFNSVHKFTVRTYTGMNEQLYQTKITKSKSNDILVRLEVLEPTWTSLKASFPAT